MIALGAGGINLEDISAPRCFEIEQRLSDELDIPVFHDDQHGTAVVALAGLMNAFKIVNKKMEAVKMVIRRKRGGGNCYCEADDQRGCEEHYPLRPRRRSI